LNRPTSSFAIPPKTRSQGLSTSTLLMIIQAIALVIGLTGVGNGQQSDRPTTPAEANVDFPKRRVVTCEGWKLHISEDLYEKDRELLDESLQLLTNRAGRPRASGR
jgi:hypothetical protein